MTRRHSCSPPPHLTARAQERHGGFTLVELLVSVGLLALMVAMVAQLTSSAGTTVGNSGKHMDADTQARLVLNRMGIDFARMLKRTDLDYSTFKHPQGFYTSSGTDTMPANLQAGNDQMAFYSEADGYFSGTIQPTGSQKNSVSFVAYNIASDPYSGQTVLRRMGKGLGWEPNSTGAWGNVTYLPITTGTWYKQNYSSYTLFPATSGDVTDPDCKTVGDQVFRMEYTYLLKSTSTQPARLSITPWDTTATPPHSSINGFQDVAAIVVTLAVLDSTSRVVVGNYSQLSGVFQDAQEGADVASTWNSVVNSPNFAASAGIPKTSAAAVRIYERYFYLDTSP